MQYIGHLSHIGLNIVPTGPIWRFIVNYKLYNCNTFICIMSVSASIKFTNSGSLLSTAVNHAFFTHVLLH